MEKFIFKVIMIIMKKKEMMKVWRLAGFTGSQAELGRMCFDVKGNRMTTLKADDAIPKQWETITMIAQILAEKGLDADELLARLSEIRKLRKHDKQPKNPVQIT